MDLDVVMLSRLQFAFTVEPQMNTDAHRFNH